MAKLVLYGNKLLTPAYAYSEKPRQGTHHFGRSLGFALFAHPLYGIERIIKKMRIYLRLQGAQLCAAQGGFVPFYLLHKLLYLS